MDKEKYFEVYKSISSEVLSLLKGKYSQMVNNARDWEMAHNEFSDTILRNQTQETGAALSKLGTVANFSYEWDRIFKLNKSNRPQIFNELIELIEESKREETVKLLGMQQGLWEMFGFWGEEYRRRKPVFGEETEEHIRRTSIIWKGKNETEFVQLVYALYEAGYLDTEEKQITDLVWQVAEAFNIDLGDHWQSNFSKSINARKAGYEPKIFENLQKAFLAYRDRLIDKKKKN